MCVYTRVAYVCVYVYIFVDKCVACAYACARINGCTCIHE